MSLPSLKSYFPYRLFWISQILSACSKAQGIHFISLCWSYHVSALVGPWNVCWGWKLGSIYNWFPCFILLTRLGPLSVATPGPSLTQHSTRRAQSREQNKCSSMQQHCTCCVLSAVLGTGGTVMNPCPYGVSSLIIPSIYQTCFHQGTADWFFHLPLSSGYFVPTIAQAQKAWVFHSSCYELIHSSQPLIC